MHRRTDSDDLYVIISIVNDIFTAHSLCLRDRLFD